MSAVVLSVIEAVSHYCFPLGLPFIDSSGFEHRQAAAYFLHQVQSLHELPDNVHRLRNLCSCSVWRLGCLKINDFVLTVTYVIAWNASTTMKIIIALPENSAKARNRTCSSTPCRSSTFARRPSHIFFAEVHTLLALPLTLLLSSVYMVKFVYLKNLSTFSRSFLLFFSTANYYHYFVSGM